VGYDHAVNEDTRVARLIEAARKAGATLRGPAIPCGPGDDAAVLSPPAGRELAWTTDSLLEGVHFRRSWASWHDVGRKAIGAALSDLAAMGAEPLGALISLVLPLQLEVEHGETLMAGAGMKLAELGCPLVGGNVSLGTERVEISVSALGAVDVGAALRRSGGQTGDALFVSGPLGWSRLGFLWLEAGGAADDPRFTRARQAQLDPSPRFELAQTLLGQRLACMDISDGLAIDLPRLARASGVAARLDRSALPGPCAEACAVLSQDPLEVAWQGGEDYELLIAGPAALGERGLGLVRVGTLIEGAPGTVHID
jgi:thiamine-monophosphate kinase